MVEAAGATSTPKKRRSPSKESGNIKVSTSKVVTGDGVEVRSTSDGGATLGFTEQFPHEENEGGFSIDVTPSQGRHLLDVLKKFFGGRGSGSPRKAKQ